MTDFKDYLTTESIPFRTDCTLKELTTFKIGGPADLVLYPESVEHCQKILAYVKQKGIKLVYIGNGSNILGSDDGCRYALLKTDRLSCLDLDDTGCITVGAGVRLVKVSSFAADNGLSGFEFAHGIPGTIGGAVFMNAGAYGGTMDQVVVSTDYLDENGEIHTLKADDHAFGYRHSYFMEHPELLILSTKIRLCPWDRLQIRDTIKDYQQRRIDKQPLEYPSAGSTFKRPEGYFAGKLIQDAGLRGFKIGDAQVSEKHCGFVINSGNATAADVKTLIDHIRNEVIRQFGVEMHCEVRFLETE